MPEDLLRFHARGTACFPDPHGADATPQRRRMVGRVHQEISPGTWAWVPTDAPDELAYHHDLAKAVRDGDLWPADAATAAACGVDFDPTFGGEVEVPEDGATAQEDGTTPGSWPADSDPIPEPVPETLSAIEAVTESQILDDKEPV